MAEAAVSGTESGREVSAQKLSVLTKMAYGVGDVGAAIYAQVTGFFLNPFLLDVARLNPAAVSVIVLIANLWDGIIDPFLGNMSDRTHTRWGRRRPWLLFGAIPFGLAFFLQWTVPPFQGSALFIYFLLVTPLLRLTYSAVNVPYTAMTPEIAADYDERTSLTSYRFAFSILGGLAAVMSYNFILNAMGSQQVGSSIAGALLGVIIALSAWTTFAFTRERPLTEKQEEDHIGIIAGLRIAFQNRPFLYVLCIYLLTWVVVEFIQANLLHYVRYWIGAEQHFVRLVMLLQITSASCLALWSAVSKWRGKKQAYYIGVTVFMPILVVLFFLQPGQIVLLYVVSVLAGACVSMVILIPWSMLPDVIDYDELQTGQRRSGVYYGLFVFVQTVGVSLALAFSPFLLGLAGYITPESAGAVVTQPDSVLLSLRLMVSFIPVGLLLLSLPLAIAYPITRERFAEIRATLDARLAESGAVES